jgi:hypothetical protein
MQLRPNAGLAPIAFDDAMLNRGQKLLLDGLTLLVGNILQVGHVDQLLKG